MSGVPTVRTDALRVREGTRYMCHVYNRSFVEPHVGTFLGASRDEALNGAYDAIVEHKGEITDEQLADARDSWYHDCTHYELDEDGYSFAFFTLEITK